MKQLKSIIFDLDDTLLNTYETLLPVAQKESWLALKEAGVSIGWEDFLHKWREASSAGRGGRDLISTFVDGLEITEPAEPIRSSLRKAFYGRKVKENLVLFDGAQQLLERLKSSFEIRLLTAGFLNTQKQKVEGLGLERLFHHIHYCDIERGQSKDQIFKDILASSSYGAEEHLSVGNRRDTDIGPAKSLGMKTCLVLRGEHVHQKARNSAEIPDFEIEDIRDLMEICQTLAPASLL